MARNKYPGYCYCCRAYIPAGYGHFEKIRGPFAGAKWRIKCVKCASGRIVHEDDYEVIRARQLAADSKHRGGKTNR